MIAYRLGWALAIVICLAALAAAAWFVLRTPDSVFEDGDIPRVEAFASDGEPVLYTVEEGASAKSIGAGLEAEGIIRSGRLFEVLVGLRGVSNALEAGEYEFERGLPAIEAVDRIAAGRTASRRITIREGLRNEEIAELLEARGIVPADAFMAALVKANYNEPFLASLQGDSLQGYLFPAGYEFSRSATAEDVVAAMLRAFQTNVVDELQLEGQDLTLEEVITLASIVEREAATAEERPIIASVFLNRLRAGIPLQADPTVQFAVAADAASVEEFGWWKRGLTFDDLKIEHPYNTYVHGGLPPGPIANPGLDSVLAVVRPAQTEYLFFVAKDDGTHVFAETLEEHERNVDMYQR